MNPALLRMRARSAAFMLQNDQPKLIQGLILDPATSNGLQDESCAPTHASQERGIYPYLCSCQKGHCWRRAVFIMKKTSVQTDVSAPQTVTDFIKLKTSGQTIQIGFTDQKVSPHAGLATFAGFLQWHRFGRLLAGLLPAPGSNSALKP